MKITMITGHKQDGTKKVLIADPRETDENGNIVPISKEEWEVKYNKGKELEGSYGEGDV